MFNFAIRLEHLSERSLVSIQGDRYRGLALGDSFEPTENTPEGYLGGK
jgi:hypothetical protein